ncbi:hypothetical protein DPMN_170146 [Dreissena polymorpha]|uniref:Uncharacterized protein n=1 Tax=Dreissena polymorpha TaxID=45954 RepID=A0A9D4DXB9_DREPO|nr:hypothetical protein DPMN_170146 [Dreissena polymorpha]
MGVCNQANEYNAHLWVGLEENLAMMFHAVQILKGVSSTSFGDTASCRILNTTNSNVSSNQLSCTAYMLRNKDKPVKCQLQLPTKHELYMSGRGTINTNSRRIT